MNNLINNITTNPQYNCTVIQTIISVNILGPFIKGGDTFDPNQNINYHFL